MCNIINTNFIVYKFYVPGGSETLLWDDIWSVFTLYTRPDWMHMYFLSWSAFSSRTRPVQTSEPKNADISND